LVGRGPPGAAPARARAPPSHWCGLRRSRCRRRRPLESGSCWAARALCEASSWGWTATTLPALALVHRTRGSPHRPRRMRSCATGGDAHDGDTMPSRTGHDPGRQVDRESIRGEPAVVLRAGETFAITTWPAALHRVGTAFPGASRSAAVTAWGCPDDMPRVPSEESQADR
jgi:hypothetical protein